MPVIITAKKAGFRRCGIAHPAEATTYQDGTFTPEQLKALAAEPMLVVQVTEAGPEEPKEKALVDMTKADLAAWLTENKVVFPPNANKAELLALAQDKAAELEQNKTPAGGAE